MLFVRNLLYKVPLFSPCHRLNVYNSKSAQNILKQRYFVNSVLTVLDCIPAATCHSLEKRYLIE